MQQNNKLWANSEIQHLHKAAIYSEQMNYHSFLHVTNQNKSAYSLISIKP